MKRLRASPESSVAARFLDLVGELYLRDDADAPVYGLRIQPEHANNRGDAHGGVLITLADLVLGYTPPSPATRRCRSQPPA